jgi:hypothetical protein
MPDDLFLVNVTLRSKKQITSPEPMPRTEAEETVASIGKARDADEVVELSWLNVPGADVQAVHLELSPTGRATPEELERKLTELGLLMEKAPPEED